MKKLIVSSVVFLLAAGTIQAQSNGLAEKNDIKTLDKQAHEIKKEKREDRITLRKLKGNEASYQSKQQFFSDFGDIPNTTWTRVDYFDEAIFTKNGKQMKAYYDADAKLVGTISPVQFTDLPAGAQKEIAKKYKDYTVTKTIFYDDNEQNETDMVLYGNQFEDEDNYFVEMTGKNKNIILHVETNGNVSYFGELK